jgi:hypothetical protein
VTGTNYVVVGDINESFNLMEYDKIKKRFEVVAVDIALRTLYKGKNNRYNKKIIKLFRKMKILKII